MKKNRPFYTIQDCIDLHGYTKKESHDLVIDFLRNARDNNFSKVEIITGIGNNSEGGKPILKKYIQELLQEEGYTYQPYYGSIFIFIK